MSYYKKNILVILFTAVVCWSHAKSMLNYTPLSKAAQEAGQIEKYEKVPTVSKAIKLADAELTVTLPQQVSAYDMVPIRYKLTSNEKRSSRMAVEAVTFEDPDKTNDQPLYDLNIPGNMQVKIDYLGSISADYLPDQYLPLTPDPQTPVSPFPPFKREKMVCSSTVRAANIVWFKFKITNVGDTIIDPEGFAGSMVEPFLVKYNENGQEEFRAKPTNLFLRFLKYLYPGDSVELWANFECNEFSEEYRLGLHPGKYQIDFRLLCRFYDKYDWGANIWAGTEFASVQVPFVASEFAQNTPVCPIFRSSDTLGRMPGYFAKFEEFMASFHIHPDLSDKLAIQDTLYVQVAPWTQVVTIKLISDSPKAISVVRIPVQVNQDTMAIQYNPENVMVVQESGKEVPAFISQSMPAMRSGFQLGPFVEQDMYDFLKEQKDLGVNVIANTAGDWWIPEIGGRQHVDMSSACYKYFYDVLVPQLDIKLIGWALYPPSASHWYQFAEPLLGRKITYSKMQGGYAVKAGIHFVDLGDPVVPEVIAAWVKYQYQRWGDHWYITRDGEMPIDLEDSWGWLRDDINIRYGLGDISRQKFHQWLKVKYDAVEKINQVWGSNYSSIEQIDPQANQTISCGAFLYDRMDNVFHDWSPAVNDWDLFRTELRLEMIRKTDEIVRRTIPNACIAPRTEGANLVIRGIGDGDNMHWRHVYYSQRRNAMIYDIVKQQDNIHFYSDYTTLPYTPQEWRQAMRQMVEDGIRPMLLPQFDHMRDILLNPYYGREYKMHYNLEKPSKGIMIHCLTAAYPWWKATYEEGGAPGILWSDYLCDGFATETQKHELKLLTENFRKMQKDRR